MDVLWEYGGLIKMKCDRCHKEEKQYVIINVNKYEGGSVSIKGNRIMIDGVDVTDDHSNQKSQIVHITIDGDTKANIDSDASITVKGNVFGDVNAGGSVNCGNISGNVNLGRSLNCKKIYGSVGLCDENNRTNRLKCANVQK